MRKNVVLLSVVFCMILMLAASVSAQVEVEFWHALSGDYGEVLQALVDEYNASQSDYVINAVYKGNYQDSQKALLAAIAAKNGPDIAQLEVAFAATIAGKDLLEPVENFANNPDTGMPAEDIDSIYPGFKAASSLNGTWYTMPFNMSVPVMYYNADMIEADGAIIPNTWEEFAESCATVTHDDQFGFTLFASNVWVFEAMVWQNGGEMFNEDYTEVMFNQPKAVETLEFLNSLAASGVARVQSWTEGRTEFLNGNACYMIDSTGSYTGLVDNAPFKVGVVHIPWASEEGKVVTIGGAVMGIFKDSAEEKKAGAWDFLKYITTPESISRLCADTGYMPMTSKALDLEPLKGLLETDPTMADMMENLPLARPRPTMDGYIEIADFIRQEIETTCLQMQTSQEGMDNAAEQAERIMGK